MRKPHIDFEFEMDHDMYHVYYEVIRFNIYLHYYYYFFLYNCPENNLGVKDIICPIGD